MGVEGLVRREGLGWEMAIVSTRRGSERGWEEAGVLGVRVVFKSGG